MTQTTGEVKTMDIPSTKEAVIGRLLALPAEIAGAERDVLAQNERLAEMECELTAASDQAYLTDRIDGKNAELRAAQLRQMTQNEQQADWEARLSRAAAMSRLTILRTELDALRSVAGLLAS